MPNTRNIADQSHAILLSSLDKTSKYNVYKQVSKYLSTGEAVIYCAESEPSKVIQQMSKAMIHPDHSSEEIEIERYIENGALTILDKDEIYSSTNQFDTDRLLQLCHSIVLKAKGKSKHKRLVAIGGASAFLQANNIDRLLEYENKIRGQEIPKNFKMICWYNDLDLFAKLPYSKVIQILNVHDFTIHKDWSYRQWYTDTIVRYVRYGIDRVLGDDSSNLIFKTLKMIYKLDRETVVSRPEVFEEKLTKILGENSAELVFTMITDTIRNEMVFARNAKFD